MQPEKAYAGIGSRETPVDVKQKMTEIASQLSRLSYVLYSGGAKGADTAFEKGAEQKIIFLPWDDFNGRKVDGIDYVQPPDNFDLVKQYHPKPSTLSDAGWKFMSRNSYQVLGPDLQTPVEFVLCWTKDGKARGGTGQAIRIAKAKNIPIFNFYHGYEEFANYMQMKNFFG